MSSLFKRYLSFSKKLKIKNNWTCQICGKKNLYNKESKEGINKIVCHHVARVRYYGVTSPLLMCEENIIVCCGFCHMVVCHGKSPSMAENHGFYGGKKRGQVLQGGGANINLNFKKRILKKYNV